MPLNERGSSCISSLSFCVKVISFTLLASDHTLHTDLILFNRLSAVASSAAVGDNTCTLFVNLLGLFESWVRKLYLGVTGNF